ncbi:MAG: hypothetical protein U1F43_33085 [Myxococcota bacterium]
MREDIAPGDLVVVDQFIDADAHAPVDSFSEDGVVAHVTFSTRSARWRAVLTDACKAVGVRCTTAAPTSASRARPSRRAPSRSSTAAGARRWSA